MDPVAGADQVVRDFLASGAGADVAVAAIARLGVEATRANAASLTWSRNGGTCVTVGATDAEVVEIDDVQYRHDRGPCLEAVRTGHVQLVDDMSTADRWPEFASAADERGYRSSLSLPVLVRGTSSGALNLYARDTGAFEADPFTEASLYAAQSALVVALDDALHELETLRTAMVSRSVIEQAKGIIMASSRCTPDEAFDLLRQQSQAENRKLREIAAELVARQRRDDEI